MKGEDPMKKLKQSLNKAVAISIAVGLILFGSQVLAKGPEQYTTQDLNEQLVMATLWMQTSAEFRALCYQTFNLAKMNLDSFLGSYSGSKPIAVIVDADETVIDNSAYEAFLIGNDFGYSSKTWTPWMAAAQAPAIPGALDFLNYAKSKNVEIFYVTNRKMVGYEGTEKNLKALGFPYVDKKHLLLRTDTSDKQPRRDIVEKDYEVAFLMGDNLNDFLSVFRKKSIEERFAETDKIKDVWGIKFIVLPNPTYGEWEGAIYDGNWGASPAEKDQMRKKHLKRWDYKP
jgi:5'-nucleotidase (lipoprotein e(P4) family)